MAENVRKSVKKREQVGYKAVTNARFRYIPGFHRKPGLLFKKHGIYLEMTDFLVKKIGKLLAIFSNFLYNGNTAGGSTAKKGTCTHLCKMGCLYAAAARGVRCQQRRTGPRNHE